MTIAPDRTTVRLPTQPEASARWVALGVKPALPLSKQPCRCDPETGYECLPHFVADDVRYERSLDV